MTIGVAGFSISRTTLIAVIADGVHLPIQPWVVDTVHFVVR